MMPETAIGELVDTEFNDYHIYSNEPAEKEVPEQLYDGEDTNCDDQLSLFDQCRVMAQHYFIGLYLWWGTCCRLLTRLPFTL